jgi:hypothetical protein
MDAMRDLVEARAEIESAGAVNTGCADDQQQSTLPAFMSATRSRSSGAVDRAIRRRRA